jgi:hypothetical protein
MPTALTPSAAGHWAGTLQQPGGPWQSYNLSLDLTQSGATVQGTRDVSVVGDPLDFGVMEVTGTVSGNEVIVADTKIVSQNLPPGYSWLLSTLEFPIPATVPSPSVAGTWASGLWAGTIQLQHTSDPDIPQPEVQVQSVSWLPLDQRSAGHAGQAAITVNWTANSTASVTLKVYQASTANGPVTAADSVRTVTVTNPQVRNNTTIVYFNAPPVPGMTTNFIQVEAQSATAPSSIAAVAVQNAAPLSYELQDTAPLAATRADRVQLWLESYAGEIKAAASARKIDSTAVAGAIAWEALVNVHPPGLIVLGPGKVHPFAFFGETDAQLVEQMGYMPKLTLEERIIALQNPDTAIKYIAAIMGAYADQAQKAGYNIRNQPAILATYYNGAGVNLLTVATKLKQKYPTPLQPGPTMGLWVANHLTYLTDALSGG